MYTFLRVYRTLRHLLKRTLIFIVSINDRPLRKIFIAVSAIPLNKILSPKKEGENISTQFWFGTKTKERPITLISALKMAKVSGAIVGISVVFLLILTVCNTLESKGRQNYIYLCIIKLKLPFE